MSDRGSPHTVGSPSFNARPSQGDAQSSRGVRTRSGSGRSPAFFSIDGATRTSDVIATFNLDIEVGSQHFSQQQQQRQSAVTASEFSGINDYQERKGAGDADAEVTDNGVTSTTHLASYQEKAARKTTPARTTAENVPTASQTATGPSPVPSSSSSSPMSPTSSGTRLNGHNNNSTGGSNSNATPHPRSQAYVSEQEREIQEDNERRRKAKRKILMILCAALCVFLLVLGGFITMATMGGLCANGIRHGDNNHWACGGSGVATATVLVVIGLAPFALWTFVCVYNCCYFAFFKNVECCGDYNEISC